MRVVSLGIPLARARQYSSLPMLVNSVALILAKVSTMGLGFVAWTLAARLFPASEVGIASAAISAIMLCTQIALLGISSAIISLFPTHAQSPSALLNTSYTILVGAALVVGGGFLILAASVFNQLHVIATIPSYAALFLIMSVLGTLGIAFDQTSTVLRRGYHVLLRGVLAGVVIVVVVTILPVVTDASGSQAIFLAWAAGAAAAFLVGCRQIWTSLEHYRYRPRVDLSIGRALLAVGLPNYALTLAERAPGPLMPILVTEVMSPVDTAHWYAVWMMAWIVLIVPIQVSINLFAEASHRPDALTSVIRHGIRSSLVLGAVAAAGVAIAAPLILSLLGGAYAATGTTPLRILALTVIPFTFLQVYFAACRASRRLREAVIVCVVSGAAGVAMALTAGVEYGLSGMAAAWLITQSVAGAWAAWRLRSLVRGAHAPRGVGLPD